VATREDLLVAAATSVDAGRWLGMLDELMMRIGPGFRRVEPRRRARAFVLGLLAELPRKNCWTITEHAGDQSPDEMQHLLSRAKWDADEARDDVRGFVIKQLGDPGAALVVDETGTSRKGPQRRACSASTRWLPVGEGRQDVLGSRRSRGTRPTAALFKCRGRLSSAQADVRCGSWPWLPGPGR
jgi:hypothetical protein